MYPYPPPSISADAFPPVSPKIHPHHCLSSSPELSIQNPGWAQTMPRSPLGPSPRAGGAPGPPGGRWAPFDPPGQWGRGMRRCTDGLGSQPCSANSLLKCWSHCHVSLQEASALVLISNRSERDNNINPSGGWQEKAPPRFKCLDKKFALIRAEDQEMLPL